MSVISKNLDIIFANILKACINGRKINGTINVGDYSAKIIVTIDFVKSRDEKSEDGIDVLWISFNFGVIRINVNFEK